MLIIKKQEYESNSLERERKDRRKQTKNEAHGRKDGE